MELLCSLHIDRPIEHHDAAKSRLRVTRKGSQVGVAYGLTDSKTAGSIMLDDATSRLVHLLDHVDSSIHVQEVIVADLLPVEVVEALLEAPAIVSCTLMGILSIPHRLAPLHREGKTILREEIIRLLCRTIQREEVIMDRRIVGRGDLEGSSCEVSPLLQRRLTILLCEQGSKLIVILSRWDDHHVGVILCRCTDQ